MSQKDIRQKKNNIAKKNKKTFTCFLLIFFCIIMVLLVMQRNQVNNLDMEINSLKREYDSIVKLNDDLQGQIMTARNLSDVERYASKVLGMVPSSASNISYISYNSYTSTASSEGVKAAAGTVLSWLSGFFK